MSGLKKEIIVVFIIDNAQNFKKSYQTQQCAERLWANQE